MKGTMTMRGVWAIAAMAAIGCDGATSSPEDAGVLQDAQSPAEAGVMDSGQVEMDAGQLTPVDSGTDAGEMLDAAGDAADEAAAPEPEDADVPDPNLPGLDVRPANTGCVAWLASEEAPATLSVSGCFDADDPTQPLAALIPFEPIAPLWSDNARKQRWFAVPEGTTIRLAEDGDFLFPPGTVLAKTFALGEQRLETRLFVHHPAEGDDVPATWAGYAYEWDEDNTDATLLSDVDYLLAGKPLEDVGQPAQAWHIPSRTQCLDCHNSGANRSLGPEVAQLDSRITYPSTGREANQLVTLDALGLFDAETPLPAAEDRFTLTGYVGSAPLEDRARSYLHTNCSVCHRPGAPGPGDLRRSTPFEDMEFCGEEPSTPGATWPTDTKRLQPGSADLSAISIRMRSPQESGERMPPLGSAILDPIGAPIVDAWINSLESCR